MESAWQVAFIALQGVMVIAFSLGAYLWKRTDSQNTKIFAKISNLESQMDIAEKRYVSHTYLESIIKEYESVVKAFEKKIAELDNLSDMSSLIATHNNELLQEINKKLNNVLDNPDYFNRCPYRKGESK